MVSDLTDRRGLLRGAALAAVGTAALATPSVAQSAIRLRAATIWPAADSGPGAVASRFAQRVAALTENRVQIETSQWTGDVVSLYRAASVGDVDMCFASEDMWLSINPAYGLFASPPGGITAGEFEGWIAFGGGRDVWSALADVAGLAPYLIGDTGLSHTLTKRAFDVVDMANVTVAASGLAAEVWRRVGASNVVSTASTGADIYNGSGSMSLMERTPGAYPARYETMMNRVNNALSLNVNKSALSRLSESDRKILQLAANAEQVQQRSDGILRSIRASGAGGAMAAVQSVVTPPELLASLFFASSAVLEDVGAYDRLASDAVWSFQLHSEDVSGWSAIGEGAFLEARRRSHGGRP